jgi:uncharacterized membrane protein YqaE (UPF0057 family)
MCGSDICLGIIAILFPPIAVWVKRGVCSADSFINIALCSTSYFPEPALPQPSQLTIAVLGFLPGLFHAWYIIAATPSPTYEQLAQHDPERGQITYYYVSNQQQPQYHQQQPGRAPVKPVAAAPQRGYGTVAGAQQQGVVQPQPAAAAASSSAAAAPVQRQSEDGAPPPSYSQVVEGDHKVQKK